MISKQEAAEAISAAYQEFKEAMDRSDSKAAHAACRKAALALQEAGGDWDNFDVVESILEEHRHQIGAAPVDYRKIRDEVEERYEGYDHKWFH